MSRTVNAQVSFADLELMHQGVCLEPVLQAISDFIAKHGGLVDRVRCDLQRGLKKPATGRNGMTAQQVLRSLILQRVKNWDFRELRERIADGFTLRRFTAFFSGAVPKHDAFNRAFNRLTPETLEAVNEAVVQAAVAMGLEKGTKLRVDTTVVETDIHHPTDPATRDCGIQYGSLPDWSDASATCWPRGSLDLRIVLGAPDAACRKSNG